MSYHWLVDGGIDPAELTDDEEERLAKEPRGVYRLQLCWKVKWEDASREIERLRTENVRLARRTAELAAQVEALTERTKASSGGPPAAAPGG